MITFKNHKDMISCWDEAGRPLCKDTVTGIEQVQADMDKNGLGSEWLVFVGQCRICNAIQNVICPATNDLDNQECHNCGDMTMQDREIPEWEQE